MKFVCYVIWVKENNVPMPKKISITVVVNGQPAVIDAVIDAPLGTIIPDALRQAGISDQPPESWELRDADGNLLDLQKRIEDYGFPPKVRLFLKKRPIVPTPKKIRSSWSSMGSQL